MSTEFYANFIKETTFDPETNSVRSKLDEAATDTKKKPASKTPKVEVEPTEVPEELHGDQHKLDHNKDMKITASDMKMVRKKGAVKDHPMKEEEELEEGTFKVQVDGLPTMYIEGSSAGSIKAQMRKKFKDPKAVVNVERITSTEKKQELRAKMSEDQAAMDAYLKKGGTIKKLPAAHARSTSDMEKDVKGRVDTSTLKTRGKVKSMEDVEQVDEISKRAKAAYTRVAARDLHHQGSKAAQGVANNDRDAIKKADRNINNRLQGIDRATKSLQKEGAMKRIATQDAEKERLGPKVKGSGLDTFKKKPMGEKFANAAQQAAVMAKLKASGDYKKPKEEVEENYIVQKYSAGKKDGAPKSFGGNLKKATAHARKMGGDHRVHDAGNVAKKESVEEEYGEGEKNHITSHVDKKYGGRGGPGGSGVMHVGSHGHHHAYNTETENYHDTHNSYAIHNEKTGKTHEIKLPPKAHTAAQVHKHIKPHGGSSTLAKHIANDHNSMHESNNLSEKDTHVTKDGRTAKKGLWYNIHKKRARGEAPAKPGDPDRPSAADLKRSQ